MIVWWDLTANDLGTMVFSMHMWLKHAQIWPVNHQYMLKNGQLGIIDQDGKDEIQHVLSIYGFHVYLHK